MTTKEKTVKEVRKKEPNLTFSIIIAIFAWLVILASFIAQALPICKMPV